MFSLLYGLYEYLFRKARALSTLAPALHAARSCHNTEGGTRTRPLTPPRVVRQTEVRLLLLGLDRAGKTSVLERLKALHAPPDAPPAPHAPTLPTVGARPRSLTPRMGAM